MSKTSTHTLPFISAAKYRCGLGVEVWNAEHLRKGLGSDARDNCEHKQEMFLSKGGQLEDIQSDLSLLQ